MFLSFLSCDTKEDVIKKLLDQEEVLSIYRVCGTNPWLLVCKFTSLDEAINFSSRFQLNTNYLSIASTPSAQGHEEKPVPEKEIKFWVFISFPNESRGKDPISLVEEILQKTSDFQVIEKYPLFGTHNFLVKLHAKGITDIDTFLDGCHERGMSTSVKCVLITKKEDGIVCHDTGQKKEKVEKAKKDLSYLLARVMANSENFVEKDKDEQFRYLVGELEGKILRHGLDAKEKKDIKDLLLSVDEGKDEYEQGELEHPNKLIEKYAVKLEKEEWWKALLFFKPEAEPTKRKQLEGALRKKLLGVEGDWFARKLYHTTGEYMIPVDCASLRTLNEKTSKFLVDNGSLIQSHHRTICKFSQSSKHLNTLDEHFVESLLINSTNISKFEKSVKDEKLNPTNRGITPREEYIKNRIGVEKEIDAYLKDFISFQYLGIRSTIELTDKGGALIQVFLKFYATDNKSKEDLKDKIDEKLSLCEIIATRYESIGDPLAVLCIIAVKELAELEVILGDFKNLCKKMEFHIIFHQHFYSKEIQTEIKCKPCPNPHLKQDCSKCIQYILPRRKDRILVVDFKEDITKEKIEISLVGTNIGLSEYLALEAKLTAFKVEKIFNELIQEKPEEASEYNNFKQCYQEIVKKGLEKYRNAYKKTLIEILKELDSDIIVFPEYTIPQRIYGEVIDACNSQNFFKQKEGVIILGSHIDHDERGYNTCPILFVKDSQLDTNKIFFTYRNKKCPLSVEETIGLMRKEGTGHLKFLNTKWGNFIILLCYDVHKANLELPLKEIDFLLIPSFNPSEGLPKGLSEEPSKRKLIIGYVNNTEAKVCSRFYVPKDVATASDVFPFHTQQLPAQAARQSFLTVISEPSPYNKLIDVDPTFKFQFTIKKLIINDPIQLDIWRAYKGGG